MLGRHQEVTVMKLYQREGCDECARVRRVLEHHGVSYQAVPVPKLWAERAEVVALPGVQSAAVPILVDGDRVLQGEGPILGYLRERHAKSFFGEPSYGLTRKVKGLAFADAVAAAKTALAKEGFGVLTEIDVKATLKKKIDVDFRNYVILGACNPALAHKALSAEPGIGLLLPCNVIVTEEEDGTAVISAIDPVKQFVVVERDDIEPIAREVKEKLARVMASIGAA
jgi:uncharacterized protein (DUF302 family)/glutaredoxin